LKCLPLLPAGLKTIMYVNNPFDEVFLSFMKGARDLEAIKVAVKDFHYRLRNTNIKHKSNMLNELKVLPPGVVSEFPGGNNYRAGLERFEGVKNTRKSRKSKKSKKSRKSNRRKI